MNKQSMAVVFRSAVGVLFLAIIVLTIGQVFFRFVLGNPLVWSEELVRLCLIWMTMIGAAVVSYDDEHLGITSIVEILPPAKRFLIWSINQLLMIVLMVIIAASSWELMVASHKTVSAALRIPLSCWRVAAPAGSPLTAFYLVERFIVNYCLYKEGRFGQEALSDQGEDL